MAFAAATAVQQTDSHTYTADFKEAWCIGSVPHGGYVTAIFQTVVKKHFETTLRKQHQPHTLALHLDFLRRTQTGTAKFVVKDVKLGRQTSVVHVTLSQGKREEVVGYITNSNLAKEEGITFSTNWKPHPQRLPVNISSLESNTDANWAELKEWPNVAFRKATAQIRSWFPRNGQVSQNIYDEWMCLRDPTERWTNEKLGFIVDLFPQICETFILEGVDQYTPDGKGVHGKKIPFWYPTLLLNLDVKKALPEGGVKFLFTRLQTKQIKNGRYDLEVVVMDEEGDVVALSHHVCFAVGAERNLAKRKEDGGEAKL
ncbi:unnamed protein product [Zymoseptoria tritici ST99CH_3D7]|uniref:Thioesterase domain-containing protein n=1 Tax=Zymoseptoria tritici (strain ST99CH_3D7) TaxID=1276538 RepID=A0A1X7RYG0_ZYMT9|nr:unnamed protein product [Zymoseptoria tritici ST99CH_3D7]